MYTLYQLVLESCSRRAEESVLRSGQNDRVPALGPDQACEATHCDRALTAEVKMRIADLRGNAWSKSITRISSREYSHTYQKVAVPAQAQRASGQGGEVNNVVCHNLP